MCLAGQLNQQFPPLGVRRKASLSGLRTDVARASEPRRKASCGLKHSQDGRATELTERAGFEPAVPEKGTPVFETGSISHSDTSP